MYQSFDKTALARCLLDRDFYLDSQLSDDSYREDILNKAVRSSENSFDFKPQVTTRLVQSKPVYSVENLPDKLVLRKCAKNIRLSANIRVKPRAQIIREFKSYLREGTKYRIYRLDITSFFESCNTDDIIKKCAQCDVSLKTQSLVTSFLRHFNSSIAQGLPRGVEISPVLAELYLKDMDEQLSNYRDVFYYSRFVDDILIVTSSSECKREFLKTIRKVLPSGLKLNQTKTQIVEVQGRTTGEHPPNRKVASVDYLGYSISVFDTDLSSSSSGHDPQVLKYKVFRDVTVDITLKKVNRYKSKISKAFYSYAKDQDFDLLRDRLTFLATNRDMLNKVNNRKVPTGVYYSHPQIDFPSNSLTNIDKFLRKIISSPQGRIGTKLNGKLSVSQKKQLFKISFSQGFNKRVFKRYCPNKLGLIARIW